MNRKSAGLVIGMVAAIAVAVFQSGCDNGGGGGSTSVDVNGFYEGTTPNGSTCAATFIQNGTSVVAPEVKINRTGSIAGTLNNDHFTFTITYTEGDTENGAGDFTADGMSFTGNLPSVGDFDFSWRGPDFANHTPLGQPLGYTK